MRKVFTIFKRIFKNRKASSYKSPYPHQPVIIARQDHVISRSHISYAALKVLYRLHKSGHAAYLVGGSVRDLLLGHIPKDFDVVTDAHPEEIQKLFRNSYIIGRRFRLVHVRFGKETIEVATFRGNTEGSPGRIQTQHGLLLRDNVFGSLEDDVWRRDFTVNALYYNIADFTVIDFTQGMSDLHKKSIRVIGDADERYREDPARMLRALRLAGKLNFDIETKTAESIRKHKELLTQIPAPRLFDKMLKIFHSGKSLETYHLLQDFQVFGILFPQVQLALDQPGFSAFIEKALKNSDERVKEEKGINSAFLFSVLLWGPLLVAKQHHLESEECNEYQALHLAIAEVIQQFLIISIPRKFITVMREIWYLQYQLEYARPRRIYKIFHHPRFRAAYDFLVLRAEAQDDHIMNLSKWWTDFQEGDDYARDELIKIRFQKSVTRRRKRKKKSEL